MKKRILYIVPHRMNRSPGQRFRCEHFIPHLQANGYEIDYANLLTAWDDRNFYKRHNYFLKLFIVIKSYFRRCRHVARVKQYNAVFIYREAFMLGRTRFERKIKRKGVPIIFDFDDAIWLNDVSDANKELKWLKRPEKTGEICAFSTLVIAGNQYLANYAKQFNDNVEIIPTTIDTSYHQPQEKKSEQNYVRIGWTGSSTTLKHFRLLIPVLEKLQKAYNGQLKIRVIADAGIDDERIEVENVPWSAHDEVARLNEIDVGIMPLPDDEWSRGKCGFKGLQYMSVGIPAVMSPVGVNTEIIEHGVNGYLAANDQEWAHTLKQLIDNAVLRKEIGAAGRATIVNRYSIDANKEKYLRLFEAVVNRENAQAGRD
ncbi:glycosyltransferase family 4 protein [Salinivirga cyanobacteriivorans]